jgi:glycosyltransferase involved in cell wall biosynthesis
MSVSVIIPAYNEEKYLEATLKSIDFGEKIVVCNGCTDNTVQVANKYANKVIVLKEKGVSKARNMGALHATHNRLVFLDADILVQKGLLKKIAHSSFSIGTSKVKPDSNKLIDKTMMWLKTQVHPFGFCTGLIFCNKELFNKVGGFNETLSLGEDGGFLRAAKKQEKFGVVNGYVYNNMRRFREVGHTAILTFWIKNFFFKHKNEYSSIR